uniref:Uncharacterized protein n=1 Tax=Cyprinus carpio TaxID=7962 RepID=A0A8C2IEM6_CYPCA
IYISSPFLRARFMGVDTERFPLKYQDLQYKEVTKFFKK